MLLSVVVVGFCFCKFLFVCCWLLLLLFVGVNDYCWWFVLLVLVVLLVVDAVVMTDFVVVGCLWDRLLFSNVVVVVNCYCPLFLSVVSYSSCSLIGWLLLLLSFTVVVCCCCWCWLLVLFLLLVIVVGCCRLLLCMFDIYFTHTCVGYAVTRAVVEVVSVLCVGGVVGCWC